MSIRACVLLAALSLVATLAAAAQDGAYAAAISRARTALAARQTADAVRFADEALRLLPGDRAAVDVKVRALAATGDLARALRTYDQFVSAGRTQDAGLLRPIADAHLRAIADGAGRDVSLRIAALDRLAHGGDDVARRELEALTIEGNGTGIGVLADAALARQGDRAAARRLGEAALWPGVPDKSLVAHAIESIGATNLSPALIQLLSDRSPVARIAAAEALAELGTKDAAGAIRALLSDEEPQVRARAALALRRLGDSSGDALVSAMLDSPSPEARMAAAMAGAGSAESRRAAVRTAMADVEPLTRVKAAEAMARENRSAALSELARLVQDTDLAVVREAGRVIETVTPADLALDRRLLAHANPWVRLYGAGSVVAAAPQPNRRAGVAK